MNLYRIRMNHANYDQYTGFIVVSDTSRSAVRFLKAKYPTTKEELIDWKSGATAEDLGRFDFPQEDVLLASFRGA